MRGFGSSKVEDSVRTIDMTRTVVAALFVLLISVTETSGQDPRRPHIVVFIADDHGQLDSPVYGTEASARNMQKLAKAGMTFTDAFVASPSCPRAGRRSSPD